MSGRREPIAEATASAESAGSEDAGPESVGEVLDELDHLADESDQVCISDVLDDFGRRSFGPFIMLPALLELSPVGGIPGVPTFLATVIALTSAQLLLGREHVWMPDFIQYRAVESRKLHKAVKKLRKVADWLDGLTEGRRLERLTGGVWSKISAAVVIALCCTVPPLEFLPFASSLPMLAIAMMGMALTVRDGALNLAAFAFAAVAAGVGGYMYMTSDGSGGGFSLF